MATPSPTPSEDNRKNNGEIAMKNALDKVMTNPVQSYDEFLKSFTYLKQGMQEKKESNKEVTPSMSSVLKRQIPDTQKKSSTDATNATPERSIVVTDTDGIEEEVLNDGNVTSRISQTKVIKTGAAVKFDNYVEDVDECDMEEITDDGYIASFTTDKPADIDTVGREEPVVVSVQQIDDTDAISDLCQGMSLDENSTDKLLMNFLADLQNEMNDNPAPNTSSHQPTHVPAQPNTTTDIQEFLNRNKKQTKVSESDGVNFDDDDDDDDDNAIDLLLDDSENKTVKVTINKDELSKELKETVKEDKKARLQEIYRNALMDSEGVMRAHCDQDDLEQSVKVMEVKDLVFPGQVEETNEKPVCESETLLDFKATYRTEQPSSGTQGEDVCTDIIEPFQLDEDFDYDNVVLTPKFSTEDLQLMMRLRTQQAVVS